MWHLDVPFHKNESTFSEAAYDCWFHIHKFIWLHIWHARYITVHSVHCIFSLAVTLHTNLPSNSDLHTETGFWIQIVSLDAIHLHKRMCYTTQVLNPIPGTTHEIVPPDNINWDHTCISKSQWLLLYSNKLDDVFPQVSKREGRVCPLSEVKPCINYSWAFNIYFISKKGKGNFFLSVSASN